MRHRGGAGGRTAGGAARYGRYGTAPPRRGTHRQTIWSGLVMAGRDGSGGAAS